MYKFTAKSHIALSVPMEKGNAHISFVEKTGAGSTFYTDNKKVAEALRKHPKFGKLFREEEVKVETKKPKAAVATGDGEGAGGSSAQKVPFSNNEDAKEYLADRFGVSRSKLRTRQEMEAVAKENGIVIEWTA